jgi:hypothetical protein
MKTLLTIMGLLLGGCFDSEWNFEPAQPAPGGPTTAILTDDGETLLISVCPHPSSSTTGKRQCSLQDEVSAVVDSASVPLEVSFSLWGSSEYEVEVPSPRDHDVEIVVDQPTLSLANSVELLPAFAVRVPSRVLRSQEGLLVEHDVLPQATPATATIEMTSKCNVGQTHTISVSAKDGATTIAWPTGLAGTCTHDIRVIQTKEIAGNDFAGSSRRATEVTMTSTAS